MTPQAEILGKLLEERHSCRAFLKKPVPEATIARILEMAQRTASWSNSQAWQVVLASGAATDKFRDALRAHVAGNPAAPDFPWPREYRGVHQARRRECGFGLYSAVGIPRGDKEAMHHQHMENYRLFGAPHVVIVTSDEALGVYGAIDCGAYVGTFILAAHSLGVASIPQAALSTHSPFVRAHFGIPEDRRVVCGISFGYEDPAHPANSFRTTRAAVDDVVTRIS
ncbi:MAG: nitroreductase [Rhodospirillaceae bacterium]|nr:nitroreductase [Rhodospirillaceae bacterium]